MPFVLMAVISIGVAVWLFGLPFGRGSVVGGDRAGRAGVRGWLFVYVALFGFQALHALGLSIAAVIIKARPSLAGLTSFVPLPSLLIYEVGNLIVVGYTVALYVLMANRRRSAIAHNIICNALMVVFLVGWHFLGMKSGFGTVVDGLPSAFCVGYLLMSRRVRNTFNLVSRDAAGDPASVVAV